MQPARGACASATGRTRHLANLLTRQCRYENVVQLSGIGVVVQRVALGRHQADVASLAVGSPTWPSCSVER